MEKVTKRKLQAIASRKHILNTAMELTVDRGFAQVSIQDICQKAGVSTGAFYHYFKSKEEIVLAWYEGSDARYRDEIIPALMADQTKNMCEKIEKYLFEMASYAEKIGVEMITQLYRAQLGVDNTSFIYGARALPEGLLNLILEGQEKGEISREVAAEQIKEELLIIMRGNILHWCQCKGEYALSDRAPQLVRRYLLSIKSE